MKTKLICAMAAAYASIQLAAMPTEEETKRAEPVVQKLMASEKEALKSGRKTRSEVAAAAMKLADDADTDAAKLLLIKGAFVLYVQDGNLEKAVETMNALEAAISDMPPQSVTNMIETALLGVPKRDVGARLYKLLDESKAESTTEKTRKDIAKLFPGWSLDSEVPQENRKEWASGFCANHRGQDNVLRLHPLNRETPIVLSRTLTLSKVHPCLFLKTASFDKNSDFLLSVLVNGKEVLPTRLIRTPDSEPWLDITVPLSAWRGSKVKIEVVLTANDWWLEHPFFKRLEVAEGNGQEKFVPEAIGLEAGRQAFSRLFPGWQASVEPAAQSSHRGQDDVVFVHPPSQQTPAVVSRTLTLPKVNPYLFLKMASFDEGSDFLLSVLVNGKEVLPTRLIRTPDSEPWQDITVPLSAWRGEKVKIEIVLTANNWWCEHPFFKRLEVAEGIGLKYGVVDGGVILVSRKGFAFRERPGLTLGDVKSKVLKITSAGAAVIPDTIDGVPVREIGDWSFHDCPELKSVVIPSCVTNIGKDAFNDCGARSVFRVAEGNPFYKSVSGHLLTKDGETLVWGVNVNGNLTIPDGVKNVAYNAYRDCAGITGVTFPDSVTSIGNWAFLNCKGLKNITFPGSVKRIDWGAFCGCSGLESVMIGNGVAEIVGVTFEYCTGLKRVSIPEGVTKIGYKAFHECKALTDVRIPSTVETIEKDAFWDCSELTSVTMLGECPDAPNDIFRDCGKLKTIHVPANAKSWAGMKEWQGIPLVSDDIVELGYRVVDGGAVLVSRKGFGFCPRPGLMQGDVKSTALKVDPSGASVIPDTIDGVPVREIGDWSFHDCPELKSVTIPSCVTNIGEAAFKDCSELESVTMLGECPDAPNDIFRGCEKLKSIRVPANAKRWSGMKCWRGIHLLFVKEDGTPIEEVHDTAGVDVEDLDFACLKTRAESGDVAAMCELGMRYRRGCDVGVDYKAAREWVMKAASNGHERANGICYALCYGVDRRSEDAIRQAKKEAIKWYMKAAENGDRCAMFNLGICYENGTGVEKNAQEAVKWMRMAADKGLALAMCNLGRCYNNGIGVDMDLDEALKWYRMAAEKGNAEAMFSVGCFCEDENESAKWRQMAVDRGYEQGRRIKLYREREPSNREVAPLRPLRRRRLMRQQRLESERQVPNDEAERRAREEAARREKEDEERRAREAERAEQRRLLEKVREELMRAREKRQQAEHSAAQQQQATADDSGSEAKDIEYKFSYKLEDGFAILTGVEPKPVGTLVVPDEIDGYLVTRIGGYNEESPFWGCDQMTRVVLPKGLEFTSFDPGAFISCKSLSSIEISDSNYQFASLDGALYSKDFSTLCVYPKTRESIELPPETKKIRFCAFRGCALKTAKIPEGVEEIDRWNLCECPDLELIEFPKSLKYLGQCAACGSGKLKKIVFNGDAPQIGLAQFSWGTQVVFTGAPADLVVEVRKGTKGWKSPGSRELPERWPTNQDESRPIRYID